MSDTVGFVGLGQMGTPMSAHVVDAGFAVVGFDIASERVAMLERGGGQGCASPRQVAAETSIVVTSLPSADALQTVLTGEDGLLAADDPESLVIVETSTLALEDKEAARDVAAAAGAVLLDCPLSGTAGQAQTRDLVVYASGDEQAVRRCVPVFEGFSRAHYYLGEFGAGSKMKFIANLLVSVHNVAAAEALVLGMKAGMDPETVFRVIGDSAGTSRMFEVRGPMMVEGDYRQPGMSVRMFQKDLRIIGDFARSFASPTPLFSAGSQVYLSAVANGFGDEDAAAVCAALERLAGLERDA